MSDSLQNFDDYEGLIEAVKEKALAIEVNSNEDAQNALFEIKNVKGLAKLIEDRRKLITAPINQEVKRINAMAKTLATPLKDAESNVKVKLANWERVLEKQRAEAKRIADENARLEKERIDAEQKKIEAEELFTSVDNSAESLAQIDEAKQMNAENRRAEEKFINQNKVKGTRKVWKFTVEDESKLPREFLVPDMVKIKAAVIGGNTNIPGINAYQDIVISIR